MKERCPICKSGALEHGAEDWNIEGQLSLEVTCTNCAWIGYIVYKIQFSHAEDLKGNSIG